MGFYQDSSMGEDNCRYGVNLVRQVDVEELVVGEDRSSVESQRGSRGEREMSEREDGEWAGKLIPFWEKLRETSIQDTAFGVFSPFRFSLGF